MELKVLLTFVTGGIKSGKSVYAEKVADQQNTQIYYIATAIITDHEMQKRVDVHRSRRPSHWVTLEENYDLTNILKILPQETAAVLVDCLTTLLTNRLWRDYPDLFDADNTQHLDEKLLEEMQITAKIFSESQHHFIVVSNEVGLGMIPPTKIGRIFCDLQGKVNQIYAAHAQHAYFTVSGIPIKMK